MISSTVNRRGQPGSMRLHRFKRTYSDGVVNILNLHDVPQQDVAFTAAFAIIEVVIIKHNTRRVNDPQAALKLYRL